MTTLHGENNIGKLGRQGAGAFGAREVSVRRSIRRPAVRLTALDRPSYKDETVHSGVQTLV